MASIHAAFRPFRNLPASSRAPWGRATLSKAARFKCILLTCAAAGEGGAGGAGSPGGEDDAITRAALAEAVELARRAQALAQQQARAELEQSWLAGGASGGLGGGDQESRPEALVSFLEEQGLTARQAEQALAVLAPQQAPETSGKGGDSGGGAQRRRPLTRAELEAKWLALGRVLAGANLAAMVASEPRLLQADSGALVRSLVALVAAFPSADVADMVQRRPGLLLLEDLPERCERVVWKLLQLHPSEDRRIVAGLIRENPSLLVRMDYYLEARSLDDLPIEIQNMMVPGGQAGIGWLYRYWAQKKQQRAQAES